ncbi:MAG TPA: DNA polymerase/3'-5' exonuclease PolX [Candidatus Paceibacterota bacterium]|nr:DNA polymerase/3'-5' exonuclease PolX [Candidatus Paceibacterota bacterium]
MKAPVHMPNSEIARILGEIAVYLDMQNEPFKPRAYEKASEAIANLPEEAAELYRRGGIRALEEIPSVGKAIAEKMAELITTGRLVYFDKLKRALPIDITELRTVEGLGPKSIAKLYRRLKVRTLADLERAARKGKIAKLEGFGAKSEEKILQSIGFAKGTGHRFLLHDVMPQVHRLEALLGARPEVDRLIVAGSVRRRKETIGDVDILAVSKKPEAVMTAFTHLPGVVRVIAHGDTKSSVKLSSGLNVDLRVVPATSYGAALNYFTGSKDHNVALRELAVRRGWKLNEYGLFKGARTIAGRTEEEIYKKLGLAYIEPEMREATGELEAARAGNLPKLIGYDDLQGDLQTQSDWTDGRDTIEALARGAAARGLRYIAITDHTRSVTIANGLDEKCLVKQLAEIDRVNKALKGKITVLKGTECDIREDGTLDLSDKVLAQLDVVGVAIHYHTKLSRRDQTERIKRAFENQYVDIFFHPTGRIVNRRPSYDVDFAAVIAEAKHRGVVLEVNASERLDLRDEHVRAAVQASVKLAIDSDAHAVGHFDNLEFGIAQARRGWAEKKDVINAWPLEKMRKMLRRRQ